LGVTPASVEPTGPATALLLANLKLSLAAMLKRDLNHSRRRDFIGGFNVRRADGTPIVSGCSVGVDRFEQRFFLSTAGRVIPELRDRLP
jgi:hypothetical protein